MKSGAKCDVTEDETVEKNDSAKYRVIKTEEDKELALGHSETNRWNKK